MWLTRTFILLLVIPKLTAKSVAYDNDMDYANGSDPQQQQYHHHDRVHIVSLEKWPTVQVPFIIAVAFFCTSICKIAFHWPIYCKSQKPNSSSKLQTINLSSIVPESCMLIVLGTIIGGMLFGIYGHSASIIYSSTTFFLFLLPQIVFEAGYFLPNRLFFDNIGTIILYAVVGTIFNTFAVGSSLYLMSTLGAINVEITLLHCLLFGSLISAVDPVAVLAVFEEVHVNDVLYILVFGESLVNDAVTVVLYNSFNALTQNAVSATSNTTNYTLSAPPGTSSTTNSTTYITDSITPVTASEIALSVGSFFVASLAGTLIGIIVGFMSAFITKYTANVRVVEPMVIFAGGYIAYLVSEIFHFSSIMSIVFCAIAMKPYVEANISHKSHTTVKYFLKMLSSFSESLIFLFLGLVLITWNHYFNVSFIMFTLLFVAVYRFIGVYALTFLANRFGRMRKVTLLEQFIMAYGGIRGAISFSLSILINEKDVPLRNMFVTTTIIVVIFTVFLQGGTIKPLVNWLHITKSEKHRQTLNEATFDSMTGHIMAGIEEIAGTFGYNVVREKMNEWDNRYFRKWLMREPPQEKDLRILQTFKKLSYKDAENYLVTHQYAFLPKNYSNASLERANTYSSDVHRCTNRQSSFIGSIATNSIDVIVPPAPYENSAMPTSPVLARNALKSEIKFSDDIEKQLSNHHLALLVGRSNTKKRNYHGISKYMLPDEEEDEKHHKGAHWRRRYHHHHNNSTKSKSRTSSFTHEYVRHHQIQPVLHHHHHYHTGTKECVDGKLEDAAEKNVNHNNDHMNHHHHHHHHRHHKHGSASRIHGHSHGHGHGHHLVARTCSYSSRSNLDIESDCSKNGINPSDASLNNKVNDNEATHRPNNECHREDEVDTGIMFSVAASKNTSNTHVNKADDANIVIDQNKSTKDNGQLTNDEQTIRYRKDKPKRESFIAINLPSLDLEAEDDTVPICDPNRKLECRKIIESVANFEELSQNDSNSPVTKSQSNPDLTPRKISTARSLSTETMV
ncbi:Sodium/hydrogen exchanger 2 [Trichoplax sp. H2]|nr:Sodium/hydrogen exchanger 2 [Trichoplax sp. H2]|eukprot:RDD43429.1 Sodium/hydrogen exchanger 2 [Trichoplax sp. H2]